MLPASRSVPLSLSLKRIRVTLHRRLVCASSQKPSIVIIMLNNQESASVSYVLQEASSAAIRLLARVHGGAPPRYYPLEKSLVRWYNQAKIASFTDWGYRCSVCKPRCRPLAISDTFLPRERPLMPEFINQGLGQSFTQTHPCLNVLTWKSVQ